MVINDVIIFPNTIAPLVVTAEPIIRLINDAAHRLQDAGCIRAYLTAEVRRSLKINSTRRECSSDSQNVPRSRRVAQALVQGLVRVEQTRIVETDPYLKVEVNVLPA